MLQDGLNKNCECEFGYAARKINCRTSNTRHCEARSEVRAKQRGNLETMQTQIATLAYAPSQ
jgi:hypothetical protein